MNRQALQPSRPVTFVADIVTMELTDPTKDAKLTAPPEMSRDGLGGNPLPLKDCSKSRIVTRSAHVLPRHVPNASVQPIRPIT